MGVQQQQTQKICASKSLVCSDLVSRSRPRNSGLPKLSKQTGADVTSARNVFPIRQVLSALERL